MVYICGMGLTVLEAGEGVHGYGKRDSRRHSKNMDSVYYNILSIFSFNKNNDSKVSQLIRGKI